MRLPTDDSLAQIDNRWHGPPSWNLPWTARYSAYWVGLVVCVLVLVVERKAGVGIGFTSVAWTLFLTVAITTGLMSLVDYERSVKSLFVTFWSEISAPRDPVPIRVEFRPRPLVGARSRRFW